MNLEGIIKGWYTPGGELYERDDGTYCFLAFEQLPALDQLLFNGEFQWLIPREGFEGGVYNGDMKEQLDRIVSSARNLDVEIPDSFQVFFNNSELQKRVPTCTACYLDLSGDIIKFPHSKDTYLLRFLNDQQSVLLWYLCVNAEGEHCVLLSHYYHEEEIQKELYGEEIDDEVLINNTAICSPSFEEFIYRFWIENILWFCLTDNLPLNESEQLYLEKARKKTAEVNTE